MLQTNNLLSSIPELSEELLTLRVNLEFAATSRNVKTIAVASCLRGEGRTTISRQLAVSLAKAGKRTVLVHADLRAPGVHAQGGRGNPPAAGLSAFLARQCAWNDMLETTPIDGLWLVRSGPVPANAPELLASPRLDALLAELKQSFQAVVIDGPPLAYIDGKLLAAKCDGVLLVVDYGKVTRTVAAKASAELKHMNAQILGAVLNRSRT